MTYCTKATLITSPQFVIGNGCDTYHHFQCYTYKITPNHTFSCLTVTSQYTVLSVWTVQG